MNRSKFLTVPAVLLVLATGIMSACTSKKAAVQRATDDGYVLGNSDAIKRQYWLKQALEKRREGSSSTKTLYYTFEGPNETGDGRKLVDHKITVPVKE